MKKYSKICLVFLCVLCFGGSKQLKEIPCVSGTSHWWLNKKMNCITTAQVCDATMLNSSTADRLTKKVNLIVATINK